MELILLLVLVGIVALVRSKLRRDGGPDIAWGANGGPDGLGTAAPALVIERGDERAVARALGRVESRHLAGSFWFAVGIAFSLLIIVLFGFVWVADLHESWEKVWITAPIFVYPLVGMTVVAVHAAVTRERRDGTAELFASCPAPPTARTGGHLRTAWVPLVAVVAFLGVFGLAVAWRSPAFGPMPVRTAGDVLAALALAAGGAFLGVALGRWAPWWPAPIVAVVLIAVVSGQISGIGEPGHWSQLRQLSTFARYPDYDLVFAIRPVWWHLAWLLSLCAAVAVIALLHDRRDRLVAVAGGVTVAAVLVTGIGTSRPLDEHEAARVASMVAHPERHQDCVERLGSRFCTFDGFTDLRQMYVDELAPVLARLPQAAPEDMVARQVFYERLEELDPEVRDRLPATLPVTDVDVDVGLTYTSFWDGFAAARIATGLWAVGLPSVATSTAELESIAGEAPGVIALWIAAGGLDLEDALELASAHPQQHDDGSVDPISESMAWPEPCDASPSPVVWSPQDLAAARALLALPETEVREVLDAEWSTWTDRGTTTAELMDRFGLPSVGTIDEPPAGGWECTY
jgi:hypothetical protein